MPFTETIIFENYSNNGTGNKTLSETYKNFRELEICVGAFGQSGRTSCNRVRTEDVQFAFDNNADYNIPSAVDGTNNNYNCHFSYVNDTTISVSRTNNVSIVRIKGIGRK